MIIKNAGTCLLLFVSVFAAHSAEPSAKIKSVNTAVAAVEDSIKNGAYASLEVKELSDVEGSPAEFKVYFKGTRIILVIVSVGHETWTNEFRYYYSAGGHPMKYMKTTHDRPDNPPKQAIIFDETGAVVWKNTDSATVSPLEVYKLFSGMQEIRASFSKY